jgi:hypothetical protein
MQSQFIEHQPIEVPEAILDQGSSLSESNDVATEAASSFEAVRFHTRFVDCMEMYADAKTVAQYLDNHQGWFCRCAHPMKVEQLGENGYALAIGRFGSFGYQVEPKIGLDLMPEDQGIYRIKTIPIPNYVAPGYDVDFNAAMDLVEVSANSLSGQSHLPSALTRVEWQLDLAVDIHFPKFIYKLPKSLIQSTGDRLLCQIVRQVSRRLTYKVQEDFHKSLQIPFPQKSQKRSAASMKAEGCTT